MGFFQRFWQIKGINYNKNFVSIPKSMIWKALIAFDVKYHYKIEQLDIITAFIESKLKENIYVEQLYSLKTLSLEDLSVFVDFYKLCMAWNNYFKKGILLSSIAWYFCIFNIFSKTIVFPFMKLVLSLPFMLMIF